METLSIDVLPNETWVHIFGFLSNRRDRFDVMISCKRFLSLGRATFVPDTEDMFHAIKKGYLRSLEWMLCNGILDLWKDPRFFKMALKSYASSKDVLVLHTFLLYCQKRIMTPHVLVYARTAVYLVVMIMEEGGIGQSMWRSKMHPDLGARFTTACEIGNSDLIKYCMSIDDQRHYWGFNKISNADLRDGLIYLAACGNLLMFTKISQLFSKRCWSKRCWPEIEGDEFEFKPRTFQLACVYQHEAMIKWMILCGDYTTQNNLFFGTIVTIANGNESIFRILIDTIFALFGSVVMPPSMIYVIGVCEKPYMLSYLRRKFTHRTTFLTEREMENGKWYVDGLFRNPVNPGTYKVKNPGAFDKYVIRGPSENPEKLYYCDWIENALRQVNIQ